MSEITTRAPRPDGIVFSTAARSEKMGVALFKRKLTLDLGPESKLKLTDEERERMKKYAAPAATMWSASDKDEEFPPKQTLVILNGLASNPDQLENDDASLVHKLMQEMGEDVKNVNIVSISCPGFGDSSFTTTTLEDEQNGPQNTSVHEYVEMARVWMKSMGLNPDNAIVSGHSAGGEASIHFAGEGYKVYALNPALHTGKSDIFRVLSILNQVTRYTHKALPRFINGISQFITDRLVGSGSDVSSLSQSNVHAHEELEHQEAFRFKSKELIDPDKFPEQYNRDNIRILMTAGDILTPASDAIEWVKSWILKKDPNATAETVDDMVNAMVIPLNTELSKKSGHDSVFINGEVAEVVVRELSALTKSRIHMSEFQKAIQAKEELPILAKQETVPVYLSDEDAKIRMLQGITLDSWIEAAQMIRERTQDGYVQFSSEDLTTYRNLFIKHPALIEVYGETIEDQIKKSGGVAAFLTEIYSHLSNDSLIDSSFHMAGRWQQTFDRALKGSSAVENNLPYNDSGTILIESRIALIMALAALENPKANRRIEQFEMLKDLHARSGALDIFRNVVRGDITTLIQGKTQQP